MENKTKYRKPYKKLTDKQVIKIKELLKQGIYQYKIAKLFNVTQAAISYINKKIIEAKSN